MDIASRIYVGRAAGGDRGYGFLEAISTAQLFIAEVHEVEAKALMWKQSKCEHFFVEEFKNPPLFVCIKCNLLGSAKDIPK